MKIADIHVHIFPHKLAEKASASIGSFYGTHTAHLASVETLLPLEQAAGIDCCAVSSSATSPHQVQHINDFIASEVRVHPNLIGLGTLFPAMEGWEAELERIAALGLKGLKIHPDFQQVPLICRKRSPCTGPWPRPVCRCSSTWATPIWTTLLRSGSPT